MINCYDLKCHFTRQFVAVELACWMERINKLVAGRWRYLYTWI